MSSTITLATLNRTIHIGVILPNAETEYMDVAPFDLLHVLSRQFIRDLPEGIIPAHLKNDGLDILFHWVSEKGRCTPITLTSGATVNPTDSFELCPTLDFVLVGACTMSYEPSEAELSFIRKAYDESVTFMTICGGISLALRAGILTGKTATAPRFALSKYRREQPQVNWVEKRWVRDGKLWTSGALINGLDCMLAFIKATWNPREGDCIDIMLKVGAAPERDVDYKDVPWQL